MNLESTRKAYAEELVKLGRENERIMVLDADISSSTGTKKFGEAFPERFVNVGVAEQCLVDVAAGLAIAGKTVFASSFAMFLAGRAFEQVRNTVAHDSLNVKLVATHAGVTVGPDGSSHQCLEDLALMRVIPGMRVIAPADAEETRQVIRTISQEEGPFYVRLARPKTPVIFDSSHEFKLGKTYVVKEGTDASIISTGIMLATALETASRLEEKGHSVQVIHAPTLKPVIKTRILDAAKRTGRIFTLEDHNIIGGLGSLVAEIVSGHGPCRVHRFGVPDVFGRSGEHDLLLDDLGLSSKQLYNRIRMILEEDKV